MVVPTYHFALQVGRKCEGFQTAFNLWKEEIIFLLSALEDMQLQ